jgi:dTDP-4-amino-4,6-dideoxygalactose transaminase
MSKILVTRSSMPAFEEYMEQVKELWESRWLTNAGSQHQELTGQLKKYLQTEQFELFSNGHLALEIAIQALGLTGEVITTPYTFLSTTQAIVRNGLTPVFCDIDPDRLTIDVNRIEPLITERTSAIVAVHVYGIPCDVEAIERIADKHHLKVIYDAAHAFGVRYQGRNIAEYGDCSMFSFHATKVFHTIEGGGVAFRDEDTAKRARHLRDFGLCPGGEEADEIGGNAKLSEFHAAMGLCNLRHLQAEISKRKKVAERYNEHLKDVEGLRLLTEIDSLERNYAYYPVIFRNEAPLNRDRALERLAEHGINGRKYFYPLTSRFRCYVGRFTIQQTPIAEDISERVLCLPMYADLALEEVDRICGILLE